MTTIMKMPASYVEVSKDEMMYESGSGNFDWSLVNPIEIIREMLSLQKLELNWAIANPASAAGLIVSTISVVYGGIAGGPAGLALAYAGVFTTLVNL